MVLINAGVCVCCGSLLQLLCTLAIFAKQTINDNAMWFMS